MMPNKDRFPTDFMILDDLEEKKKELEKKANKATGIEKLIVCAKLAEVNHKIFSMRTVVH